MDVVGRKFMLVTVGLKGLRLVSGADGVQGRGWRGGHFLLHENQTLEL